MSADDLKTLLSQVTWSDESQRERRAHEHSVQRRTETRANRAQQMRGDMSTRSFSSLSWNTDPVLLEPFISDTPARANRWEPLHLSVLEQDYKRGFRVWSAVELIICRENSSKSGSSHQRFCGFIILDMWWRCERVSVTQLVFRIIVSV